MQDTSFKAETISPAMNFKKMIDEQRQFFNSGQTLPLSFRKQQLTKLKSLLQVHETQIAEALYKDLHKAPMEAIFNEILLVTKEIDFIIKNLHKWARPTKVPTPIILWPGRSEIHFEPHGCTLIIGPWNYPFMLVFSPLIGAICAGNCALIKPSEIAVHTQNLIAEIINTNFPSNYIKVIKAGPAETTQLLQEKFDYIFFTGGTQIGKIIMEAAAKHLTPLTLELGGKSPCIVDETADLSFAARRIAWAKTTNAGQVCIAPDFLYVHHSCKEQLIKKISEVLLQFYGNDPEKSASYGRIINKKHFERLLKLMQRGNILVGGKTNEAELYIEPTLIDGVTWDDPIMQEEIFGPLLPILTYDNLDEVIQVIKSRPQPLAFYLFTKNKENENKLLNQISFGDSCVNDCILHIANLNLPFGGVGLSGMGNYHGRYSFETFSHRKSVYKKTMLIDLKLEYPPFSKKKLWWIRQLLKL